MARTRWNGKRHVEQNKQLINRKSHRQTNTQQYPARYRKPAAELWFFLQSNLAGKSWERERKKPANKLLFYTSVNDIISIPIESGGDAMKTSRWTYFINIHVLGCVHWSIFNSTVSYYIDLLQNSMRWVAGSRHRKETGDTNKCASKIVHNNNKKIVIIVETVN